MGFEVRCGFEGRAGAGRSETRRRLPAAITKRSDGALPTPEEAQEQPALEGYDQGRPAAGPRHLRARQQDRSRGLDAREGLSGRGGR